MNRIICISSFMLFMAIAARAQLIIVHSRNRPYCVQTTGIVEVINKTKEVRSNIYNLQGQRLSSLQKGLNIVNGQKIFVK